MPANALIASAGRASFARRRENHGDLLRRDNLDVESGDHGAVELAVLPLSDGLFAPSDGVIKVSDILLRELPNAIIGHGNWIVFSFDEALLDFRGDAALIDQLRETSADSHEKYRSWIFPESRP